MELCVEATRRESSPAWCHVGKSAKWDHGVWPAESARGGGPIRVQQGDQGIVKLQASPRECLRTPVSFRCHEACLPLLCGLL